MEAHRISVDEVRERLDRGQEILFVDTRNPKDWAASDVKVPLALRIPADEIADHLGELPHDGPIVAYCT
jgi:rhodanese-related sulfurtransferase